MACAVLAALGAGLGPAAPAGAAALDAGAMNPHTVRTIRVAVPDQHNWIFAIQPLIEPDLMRFRDADGAAVDVNEFRGIRSDFRYGFSFLGNADFDMAYAVTAISHDDDARTRGNPKCVFALTALAPAIPQNTVVNFAGAACRLQRDADGSLYLLLDRE